MASLFRYFSNDHYAREFVEEGLLLFSALSYFRDYEENAGVRADPYEGTLVHRPTEGLRIRVNSQSEEITLPHAFEARVKEDDILIYCLSTNFSATLRTRFKATTVVEIRDRGTFLSRTRRALRGVAHVSSEQLVSRAVRYYQPHEPPIVDWALPERIALRKPKAFEWQQEYRLAIPVGGAFAVENVQLTLTTPEAPQPPREQDYPRLPIRVGKLSSFCRIHRP